MTDRKPLIILIAGPYRSGTNDDPALIARNLDRLESFALPIYQRGTYSHDRRVGRPAYHEASRFDLPG